MTEAVNLVLRPGYAIRLLRKDKGWTIKQLAEKSGVHCNQVARIELRNTGGWFTIVAILQALGVSISFGCQSEQLQKSTGGAGQDASNKSPH